MKSVLSFQGIPSVKVCHKAAPSEQSSSRKYFFPQFLATPAHACGFIPKDVQLVNRTEFAEEFTQLLLKGRYIERGSKKETRQREGGEWWEQINVETGCSLHPSIWELDRQTSWWRLDLVHHHHHHRSPIPLRSRSSSSAVPKPPSQPSSSYCSSTKRSALLCLKFHQVRLFGKRWVGEKDGITRVISSEPHKLLIQRIQTIGGGYEARLTSHFGSQICLFRNLGWNIWDLFSDRSSKLAESILSSPPLHSYNKKWWVFAFRLLLSHIFSRLTLRNLSSHLSLQNPQHSIKKKGYQFSLTLNHFFLSFLSSPIYQKICCCWLE